jgi:hypothetical protein
MPYHNRSGSTQRRRAICMTGRAPALLAAPKGTSICRIRLGAGLSHAVEITVSKDPALRTELA